MKKFPETVPLLTSRQFTCGQFFLNSKRKKCCLLGWAIEVFTDNGEEAAKCEAFVNDYNIEYRGDNTKEYNRCKHVLEKAQKDIPQTVKKAIVKAAYSIEDVRNTIDPCRDMESRYDFVLYYIDDIPSINDDDLISKTQLAQIWNEAMKILGYTETL